MISIDRRLFTGGVPDGEYHTIESSDQKIAIKFSRKIGKELAENNPEIADLYEQGLSYIEIAKRIIPDTVKKYPKIAPKAIGYAIREINNRKKQETITKEHRRVILETNLGDRLSPENKKRWRNAQAKRTIMYGTPTEALIEGRGQTPWSQDEKNKLFELLQNEHGTPDYSSIADTLNQLFHSIKSIRNRKSLGNYVRDMRRKSKK